MKPYYEDDLVTLYHGDCLEIMPSLSSINAVISDPPYGIGVRYGDSVDDSRADYWSWLRDWVDVARSTSPVVAFTHRVAALREVYGWDHVAVWNKPVTFGTRIGNSPFLPHWEPIFIFGMHSLGTKTPMSSDVFTHRTVPVSTGGLKGRESWAKADVAGHPAPKPEGLFTELVRALAPASGATVLDPFAGSGTTLRTAVNEGKRAVGIEIEERYCELIAKRLSQQAFDLEALA